MAKAVMVIDMQNVCIGENHAKFFKYENKKLITSVNKVIKENEGNPVLYILTIMKDNFINRLAPFKAFEGSENAALVSTLERVSDDIFIKHSGDAFTNPMLKKRLEELNVNEIEIVGLDGGGCVALTALGAVKAGYQVTINLGAVGTQFKKKADKLNKRLNALGAKFIY